MPTTYDLDKLTLREWSEYARCMLRNAADMLELEADECENRDYPDDFDRPREQGLRIAASNRRMAAALRKCADRATDALVSDMAA